MRFDPEEPNSQEGPLPFDQKEGKSQDEEVCFSWEGDNSCHDQVGFAPVHLAPGGGNSHD